MVQIPTRTHGAFDYLLGGLLIVLPLLLLVNSGGEFARNEAESKIVVTGERYNRAAFALIGVGVALIALAFFTQYERGARKIVPMPIHIGVEGALALFLIVSPWLMGFAGAIVWPHLLAGAALLTLAARSRREPPLPGPPRA